MLDKAYAAIQDIDRKTTDYVHVCVQFEASKFTINTG